MSRCDTVTANVAVHTTGEKSEAVQSNVPSDTQVPSQAQALQCDSTPTTTATLTPVRTQANRLKIAGAVGEKCAQFA